MTNSERRAPRLAELFDVKTAEIRGALGERAEPSVVQAWIQHALDTVAAQAPDEISRQATEIARTALVTLDAVSVDQPRPAPRPSAARRGGFGGLFGSVFPPDEPVTVPMPPPRLQVSVERLLAAVRDTLEAADVLRRAATPPPPEIVVRPWADDANLVALLQDLFAGRQRQSPEFLLKRIDQLVDELDLDHGVQVVEFDGANRSLFEVNPTTNPEITGPRTVRPALTRDGHLVRAGEAREPRAPVPVPAPHPAPDPPWPDPAQPPPAAPEVAPSAAASAQPPPAQPPPAAASVEDLFAARNGELPVAGEPAAGTGEGAAP